MPACRWPSSTVTTRRPFARTLLWTGSLKCISLPEAGPDEDGAAPRHRLARVADEVQEQLADLSHVGDHLGKVPGEALLEGDAGGGQLGPDEVEEVAYRLVEVGAHELRLGKARVAQ